MGLAREVWEATKILSVFSWQASKFIVKNTPAAIGMLMEVRKEISNDIAVGIQELQRQQKIAELDEKIKSLPKEESMLNQKGLLDKASGAYESVINKYEEHARDKAIKAVNQKLSNHNLKAEELSPDDYEAMVSDEPKDIKLAHSKTVAKGMLAAFGLDILLGF